MNILISYQTQSIPPPYAYAATLSIALDNSKKVELDFQMEYLGREELNMEEIIAEGFSSDDDFSWKGTLGNNWHSTLTALPHWDLGNDPLEEHYIHISIDDEKEGFPVSGEDALLLVQELMQAGFEAAGKEAPLTISLADEKGNVDSLLWEFAKRTVSINKQSFNQWTAFQRVMSSIYSFDFQNMKFSSKKKALSINPGDGWYELGSKQFHSLQQQIDAAKSE
ncbi:MAG: hypothetical protein Tsb0034_07980 [Ekhidna sp.]